MKFRLAYLIYLILSIALVLASINSYKKIKEINSKNDQGLHKWNSTYVKFTNGFLRF